MAAKRMSPEAQIHERVSRASKEMQAASAQRDSMVSHRIGLMREFQPKFREKQPPYAKPKKVR